jgi:ABC-type sugar transport system ATPase subunit
MSIVANISLPLLKEYATAGWVKERGRTQLHLRGRPANGAARQEYVAKTRELSGGNQQKVVLAKWLATQPRI